MKTRRWLTWLVFAVCVAAVVEGLGWVTWQALRLERSERDARAQAGFQESIRLALWRMESEITPIIAKEAARPYFQYQPFYAAERAYTKMLQMCEPGEVKVPSPLLEAAGEFIRLHYQIGPDGTVTSPQVPTGALRDLAESQYVDPEFIVLAEQRLRELTPMVRPPEQLAERGLQADDRDERGRAANESQSLDAATEIKNAAQQPVAQQAASNKEYAARQQAAQIANAIPERKPSAIQPPQAPSAAAPAAPAGSVATAKEAAKDDRAGRSELRALSGAIKTEGDSTAPVAQIEQGPLEPLWRTNPATGSPELLVQRTVRVQGGTLVQGFWIDWPALRARLRSATADLLPAAGLVPLTGPAAELAPGALRLASIPVLLAPGSSPAIDGPWLSTTHGTLALTWLAVVGAVIAIGVVLRASMDLSDRRGRFVSAVTHELRTPLTTFCMYTEMLAGGMVPDQAKREYLATLRTESARLAGIVENVLDYARLGGAARVNGQPRTSASDLLERTLPTLRRRAQAAGMELNAEAQNVNGQALAVDPATFERILLNLVDNSCKYAATAPDRRIHLLMAPAGSGVQITVRDHGPGVPRAEFRRIFRPFHRAKRDADGPQSGLGLGLALARGLARSLGGDLKLSRDFRDGAEFTLTLPAADPDESARQT